MKYMYVYIYIYHRSIETKPLPSFHIKLFHTKCLKGPSCFYHRKVPFVTSMSSLGTSGAWWCPGCLQWRPHLEGRQCCRVNWCTVDPLRKGGRVVKIKVLVDVNQGASGCSNWIPYWFHLVNHPISRSRSAGDLDFSESWWWRFESAGASHFLDWVHALVLRSARSKWNFKVLQLCALCPVA